MLGLGQQAGARNRQILHLLMSWMLEEGTEESRRLARGTGRLLCATAQMAPAVWQAPSQRSFAFSLIQCLGSVSRHCHNPPKLRALRRSRGELELAATRASFSRVHAPPASLGALLRRREDWERGSLRRGTCETEPSTCFLQPPEGLATARIPTLAVLLGFEKPAKRWVTGAEKAGQVSGGITDRRAQAQGGAADLCLPCKLLYTHLSLKCHITPLLTPASLTPRPDPLFQRFASLQADLAHCTSLYCASQALHFLQVEGLWQHCVKQVYRHHF